MIEISNLIKAYKDNMIFQQFSLSFKDNEITAVLGTSGCGKTTLLNILMGIDKDFSGTIEGISNKRISVVFQENRLIETGTVKDNLIVVNSDLDECESMIEALGMKGFFNSPIASLSGGMKRRVALARALLYGGDIYIFDEPFKGMDLQTKEKAMKLAKEKISKKTCIFVTHDLKEAKVFADRIVTVSGGLADNGHI